ncbi:fasciclin-like arabinogalactan family protein [Actinidia rufa]|uniref:Fasciclin-like arabinogalactan family protein n=1 Tax=Actinidia rufa TaxID=165716 RepID=A0A7J0F802_9ERIC|nr:fasciclin-like arabinogalactan family protein [Actinidia rufa]
MASNFPPFAMFSLYFTILTLFLSRPVTAMPEDELESVLAVLRARGYNLFGNAVVTSDIYSDLLDGNSFTLFAPTDASLFSLDMTASAADYTASLRLHVVPSRLSASDLRRLPSGSLLPTLFPRHEIRFQRRPASDGISVDDVDVVVPGLFYGRDVAVHGLGGILYFTSQVDRDHRSSPPPPPTVPVGHRRSPHPPENQYGNHGEHRHHAHPPENISPNRMPAPPANFSDNVVSEPSNAEGTDDRKVVSPSPDPASFDRFPRADSLEKAYLVSSASRFSPESSTAPITEPEATSSSIGEGWNLMQPFPMSVGNEAAGGSVSVRSTIS